MILSDRGVPLMCEHGDAPATSAWSGIDGRQHLSCHAHNPWSYVTMPLPLNFTSQSLCHACGQPVRAVASPAQVVYPGTAG